MYGPYSGGPLQGEGGIASGVWTLADVVYGRKTGNWPAPVVPRQLWAWGASTRGILGNNQTGIFYSSPIQIGALTNWAEIVVGSATDLHALATDTSGALWAWGANPSGELGISTVTARSSPVQVGALTNWARPFAGGSSSIAIKFDGSLWAWGDNTSGELGLGDVIARSSPVQVGQLLDWSSAAMSSSHTVALKKNGTLWAWGDGDQGQLGNGSSGAGAAESSPVQVGTGTNWVQVAAGTKSSFAIRSDYTLWSWGEAQYIGQGNSSGDRLSPSQVGALTNWARVAAKTSHVLAVKTDGTLWAWGLNTDGQLGIGVLSPRSSPVQVGALTDWASVSVHTSQSASVKTDGTLWTWGRNVNGAGGDGTTIARSSPVQIGALTAWAQPLAGDGTSFATYKVT